MDEMFFILAMALNFSLSHQYCMFDDCLGTGHIRYNCADFSHDLVVLLRRNNITSFPMCGWVDHLYHAWVGVEVNNSLVQIEPQTGKVIHPSGFYYMNGRRCVVRGLT